MNVTISLPDDLWEGAYKSSRPLLVKQLERFRDVEGSRRALVLTGQTLEAVERLVGLPGVSGEQLVSKLDAALALGIDGAKVVLKPGQIKRIKGEADHYGESFGKRAEKLIGEALDQYLGVY